MYAIVKMPDVVANIELWKKRVSFTDIHVMGKELRLSMILNEIWLSRNFYNVAITLIEIKFCKFVN